MKPTDRFLDTLEPCLWHAGDSPDHAELARFSLFLLLVAGVGTPTADGGARIQLEVRSSTVGALRAACRPLTGVDEAGLEESQVFELPHRAVQPAGRPRGRAAALERPAGASGRLSPRLRATRRAPGLASAQRA